MATIRVREWTKEQIERIQEAESHSSHDSVIKSLLKDRQLASFASPAAQEASVDEATQAATDTAYADLTVIDELERADNGVVFLWCPNCANELAHLSVENPLGITVYEMECQRCLTHLDHHAVVGIEIGYPIEQRLVDDTLEDDLKTCVIDYWDRTLEQLATNGSDRETSIEQLIWQFDRYVTEFNWDWPADVAVVGVESGETYYDDSTGDRIEVRENITDNRKELNSYRIQRHGDDAETDVLDTGELTRLVLGRTLYLDVPDE
jgi:hypothetical protein